MWLIDGWSALSKAKLPSADLGDVEVAQTDDVADTVHYGEVADAVAQIVAGDPVNLIETLAEHIADRVLAFPGVFVVRVTVHKPQAPIQQQFTDVSVTITRERAEAGE